MNYDVLVITTKEVSDFLDGDDIVCLNEALEAASIAITKGEPPQEIILRIVQPD